MCNLYSYTRNVDAVRQLARAMVDRTGFNEQSRDVYPNYLAPVVRVWDDGVREIAPLQWGMPSPPQYAKGADRGVTNIRNVTMMSPDELAAIAAARFGGRLPGR